MLGKGNPLYTIGLVIVHTHALSSLPESRRNATWIFPVGRGGSGLAERKEAGPGARIPGPEFQPAQPRRMAPVLGPHCPVRTARWPRSPAALFSPLGMVPKPEGRSPAAQRPTSVPPGVSTFQEFVSRLVSLGTPASQHFPCLVPGPASIS